jgi:manganese peroxidase
MVSRYEQWAPYGIGAANLIQMGANVATVVCPEGPRIRTFIGRIDNDAMPPERLLPDVNGNINQIIRLFEDKTIKPNGLAALVGAHTTSQQRFAVPQRALDPQDSTPGVWDTLVYSQVAGLQSTPKRVFKFPSDIKLSQHPRARNAWRGFADPNGGQQRWNDVSSPSYPL